MQNRFVAIWFRYLITDWFARRQPALRKTAFVVAAPSHGRMVITASNAIAEQQQIFPGMNLADAKAIHPSLEVLPDQPGVSQKLLKGLAAWCIRYTPFAAIESDEGLILDASGCAHLWGGEAAYLTEILNRLKSIGYAVRIAMADTVGAAWAASRFGSQAQIIDPGTQSTALLSFPSAALRLEPDTIERLQKLGLHCVKDFITMPRSALRRRFGMPLLQRIDQAMGDEEERLQPVIPVETFSERLASMDPILTRTGIEIALEQLLGNLCERLKAEQKGLRSCLFKCFRTDGKMQCLETTTTRASYNPQHLFKLFEPKLDSIEPQFGIEVFLVEAQKLEPLSPLQEKIWEQNSGLENTALAELLDRFAGRFGTLPIQRYLPDEHYWPERSMKRSNAPLEQTDPLWKSDRPRPLQLLSRPEPIEVTAPIPDYPPMLFRYKGKLHSIKKADGPERIEQEWWLEKGKHRDYYYVEDEEGRRYWIFRLGHYDAAKTFGWFLHGFFP